MAKQAVFTMELDPALRDAFVAAARRSDRTAPELVRELMAEFVETNPEPDEAYWTFVERKVEAGRAAVERGEISTQEDVEADARARREAILASMNDRGT